MNSNLHYGVDVLDVRFRAVEPPSVDFMLSLESAEQVPSPFGGSGKKQRLLLPGGVAGGIEFYSPDTHLEEGGRLWLIPAGFQTQAGYAAIQDAIFEFFEFEIEFDSAVHIDDILQLRFQYSLARNIDQWLISRRLRSHSQLFYEIEGLSRGSIVSKLRVGAVLLVTAVAGYPSFKDGLQQLSEDIPYIAAKVETALRGSRVPKDHPKEDKEATQGDRVALREDDD